MNWKDIQDDREKYAAYLCSREWSVLKKAVHKRAEGLCERCQSAKIDSVHHLTYERKYTENLSDLQALCKFCHDFIHGKSDFDPEPVSQLIRYLLYCKEIKKFPAPWEAIEEKSALSKRLRTMIFAINTLQQLLDLSWTELEDNEDIETGIFSINNRLPFCYTEFPARFYKRYGPEKTGKIYKKYGYEFIARPEWLDLDSCF